MPHCEEVIISEITRGDGKATICRRVVQVHNKKGELIAEKDEFVVIHDMLHPPLRLSWAAPPPPPQLKRKKGKK